MIFFFLRKSQLIKQWRCNWLKWQQRPLSFANGCLTICSVSANQQGQRNEQINDGDSKRARHVLQLRSVNCNPEATRHHGCPTWQWVHMCCRCSLKSSLQMFKGEQMRKNGATGRWRWSGIALQKAPEMPQECHHLQMSTQLNCKTLARTTIFTTFIAVQAFSHIFYGLTQ